MTKFNVYNHEGKVVGEYELSTKVFGVEANQALVHQAVVTQMANMRQVIAHTKGRAEVSGGGKKPWRQKGTGRARVGSNRSPLWRGGGIIFGPTNQRNFKMELNKKMGRKAMMMALTDKAASGHLALLDTLEMTEFKTKNFAKLVLNLATNALAGADQAERKCLIINAANDEKAKYSARNLQNVTLLNIDNINILDLIKHENLILTVAAVKTLEARYN
jgi:large subunit ribosomal protein L4